MWTGSVIFVFHFFFKIWSEQGDDSSMSSLFFSYVFCYEQGDNSKLVAIAQFFLLSTWSEEDNNIKFAIVAFFSSSIFVNVNKVITTSLLLSPIFSSLCLKWKWATIASLLLSHFFFLCCCCYEQGDNNKLVIVAHF